MNLKTPADDFSIIHAWDPRARILSLMLLIASIATLQSINLAILGLVVSLGFLMVSRIPLQHAIGNMRWPVAFLLPFLFILPFSVRSDAVLSISFVTISLRGTVLGAMIFLKGLAAVILAQVMLGGSSFTTNAMALKDLGMPDSLVQIFIFSYRYIDLLGQELQSTFRSLSSRGFERRPGRRTAIVYGNAFAALLLRSHERSERMLQSMLSRGYSGHLPHQTTRSMELKDALLGLMVVLMAISLKVMEAKV